MSSTSKSILLNKTQLRVYTIMLTLKIASTAALDRQKVMKNNSFQSLFQLPLLSIKILIHNKNLLSHHS